MRITPIRRVFAATFALAVSACALSMLVAFDGAPAHARPVSLERVPPLPVLSSASPAPSPVSASQPAASAHAPETVIVPKVTGRSLDRALRILAARGLEARVYDEYGYALDDPRRGALRPSARRHYRVSRQKIPPRTKTARGTAIAIEVRDVRGYASGY